MGHKTRRIPLKTIDVDAKMVNATMWLNSHHSVFTLYCCQGDNVELSQDYMLGQLFWRDIASCYILWVWHGSANRKSGEKKVASGWDRKEILSKLEELGGFTKTHTYRGVKRYHTIWTTRKDFARAQRWFTRQMKKEDNEISRNS